MSRTSSWRTSGLGGWGDIHAGWLDAYHNHREVPGQSVIRKVTADMEWCSEAYMQTDYAKARSHQLPGRRAEVRALLPRHLRRGRGGRGDMRQQTVADLFDIQKGDHRSEEHTSE